MGSEIEATANATQAVAEATGKAIEASRDAGGFLNRIFGPALEELGGSWHDRVRYHRLERLMHLEQNFHRRRAQLGFTGPVRHINPKVGLPLLEAASLEEDETLMEMFATLLANATDGEVRNETRKAFVTILGELEPFDAKVLMALYACPMPEGPGVYETVCTNRLPDHYVTTQQQNTGIPGRTRRDVEVALWNLARLGMLAPGGGWGGVTTIFTVTLTALGHDFLAATTTPADREAHRPRAFEMPDEVASDGI